MTEQKEIKLTLEEAAQLDQWVKKMLLSEEELKTNHEYTKLPPKKGRQTYIQDPIWGNIEIAEQELALLSTPLLQRLRYIKQLSSGHLFFPGATHTRFEHSIGVLEQTSRMYKWMKQDKKESQKKRELNNLRFAALCHDIGHGPFSHDSEAFFKTLPPFDKKKEGLDDAEKCQKDGSAEDLSALIVSSRHFKNFCTWLNDHLKIDLDVEFIANAITGRLASEGNPLGAIIKGPFDADKIDYLTRDGACCGVPVEVDMQLIHRSLSISKAEGTPLLVGEAKAAPALIQLYRHRQYMFAAVYHHKVARICKAMFVKALDCAHEDGTKVNGKCLRTAFDFLELDNEMLLTPGIVSKGTRAADLLTRIRNRNLFKVALELGKYPRCINCKRFKQHRKGNGCERCEASCKTTREKIQDICLDLAKKVGLRPHLLLFAEAPALTYKEADTMPLWQDGEIVRLGEILDLNREADSLQGFLESDFLCCPVEYVRAVRREAWDDLGQYSFKDKDEYISD